MWKSLVKFTFVYLFLVLLAYAFNVQAATSNCQDNLVFSDKMLQELLNKSALEKSKGVIYSWSPHMILSIDGIAEMRYFAPKYDFDLTVVMDPSAGPMAVQSAVIQPNGPKDLDCQRIGAKRLKSSLHESVTIHYPTYLFYQNGKFLLPRHQGHENFVTMRKLIKRKFKDL